MGVEFGMIASTTITSSRHAGWLLSPGDYSAGRFAAHASLPPAVDKYQEDEHGIRRYQRLISAVAGPHAFAGIHSAGEHDFGISRAPADFGAALRPVFSRAFPHSAADDGSTHTPARCASASAGAGETLFSRTLPPLRILGDGRQSPYQKHHQLNNMHDLLMISRRRRAYRRPLSPIHCPHDEPAATIATTALQYISRHTPYAGSAASSP